MCFPLDPEGNPAAFNGTAHRLRGKEVFGCAATHAIGLATWQGEALSLLPSFMATSVLGDVQPPLAAP